MALGLLLLWALLKSIYEFKDCEHLDGQPLGGVSITMFLAIPKITLNNWKAYHSHKKTHGMHSLINEE